MAPKEHADKDAGTAPKRRTRKTQKPTEPGREGRGRDAVLRVLARGPFLEVRRGAAAAPVAGFDRAVTFDGSTTHFGVYYQTGFSNGPAIAAGILTVCERDYAAMSEFFNQLALPNLPLNVVIAPGIGGAYHYGCAATDLYCDGDSATPPNLDLTRFLMVAEAVEVFSAAQNRGWDCGASNGEGLSRVLATELYPAQLDGFATAAAWLDSPRADWVSRTDPTDQNAVSTGCAVLFLNYLHYQLGFAWPAVVAAAGATFEACYQALTGRQAGFAPFKALLDSRFPPGRPSGLISDNPFPIA